jgi:hypothetical protein
MWRRCKKFKWMAKPNLQDGVRAIGKVGVAVFRKLLLNRREVVKQGPVKDDIDSPCIQAVIITKLIIHGGYSSSTPMRWTSVSVSERDSITPWQRNMVSLSQK